MHPGSGMLRTGWRSPLARVLALSLSALLILQVLGFAAPVGKGPSAASGRDAQMLSRWPAPSKANPQAKIDQAVGRAFVAGGQATYLVKMRAQANVEAAARAGRKNASMAMRELAARTAVINELQRTAQGSQSGLLNALAKERAGGGVKQVESFWISNMLLVTSTHDVMQRIAQRADVEAILPNLQIHLVAPQVDTAGDPSTQSIEWGVQRVGAPNVWADYGIDGTGTVVASLDTGVDWTHPALQQQWRGYDPSSGATDATYSWYDAVNAQSMPYDDHGHGTHTIGTAVGVEPDGSNQIGVAPGARWVGVKILSASGSGSAENILRAGEWLLAPGGDPSKAPDVVNNSWGGGPGMDDWFRDIVLAWRAAGIVPVFAAGNSGPSPGSVSSPGNYPESFAVGATDINDNLAGFSGRGPSPYDEIKPEVAAPGVNIRSSVPGGGYQGGWNGTSMAAPHVAGVVALLRQANAALTVDEIETILADSADAKTNATYPSVPNNGFGSGILNAYNAVAMVADGVGRVSGRVLTGGDDFEPPVIVHTAVTEGFKYLPVELVAQASDNVAVIAMQLRFRMPGMSWWGVVEMSRTSGDHMSGTYHGVIPADVTSGARVDYYIQATDYGGNTASSGSAMSPHVIHLMSGITAPYLMDFEGATTGWTSAGVNNPWQIGVPTSGPGNAHSGVRVAATNLSGDYADSTEAYLLSPPIDMQDGGAMAMRFWHWYNMETNWDYGFLIATGDGGENWDVLDMYTGESGGWNEVVVDLSAYAGSPAVFVAYYLLTDESVTRPGWYVDDVELYRATDPPPAPTSLSAEATATGSVMLSWNPSSGSGLDHYTLYRSTTSGSGHTMVAETPGTTALDSDTESGATYYYVVTATDMFGNESAPSAEASVTLGESTILFFDDMESGEGGWTHGGSNDPWQWGAPTSGPSGAYSGTKVWATNLSGAYANSTNAYLRSPSIDLAGMTTINLQFAHWYHIENNWDFGDVEISTDNGSTWINLATYTGTSGEWQQPLFDLSAYAGETVQIRFVLRTDSSVTYAGWYIDDVLVAGTGVGGSRVSRTLAVKAEPATVESKAKGKPIVPAAPQVKLKQGPTSIQAAPKTGIQKATVSAGGAGIMSLPLEATVTVMETGRVVRTDPANGAFSLNLPARDFTLRAESYGYHPQTKSVSVPDGGETQLYFVLEPMATGQIEGQVTDARTGEPMGGVSVRLTDDARVPTVTTDADGSYQITALEGDHNVDARLTGYYPAEQSIYVPGGHTVTVDLSLEPFVGMPGEIAYDDGTAENAWGFYDPGNGWGVRMTAPAGQSVAVTAGRFFLWDSSWPNPGGNSFRAAIYSAKADGTPDALLAGPVVVTDAVRGAWNDVDFSGHGVMVSGDFYMVFLQDQPFPNTPGLAFDDNPPDSERNWQVISGGWSPWDAGGNAMIRAVVQIAVGPPTITSPLDGSHTNNPATTVSGVAAPSTTVALYLGGEAAGTTSATAGGTWSTDISLTEGENVLTATATVPGDGPGSGTTRPSAPVVVILDTVAPAIDVTSPMDGAHQNSRILMVRGTVIDEHLAQLTVNGANATVGPDGSFSTEVLGSEGLNTVTVRGEDRAGNSTTVERTVYVDTTGPVLSGIEPATDQTLGIGDVLTVAFDSEPGLTLAAFEIAIDLVASSKKTSTTLSSSLAPGEIAMSEVSTGRYEGQWTVPEGFAAPTALVRVRAVDSAGNETRDTASGRITLVSGSAPVAVIAGPTVGRINDWLSYSGRSSFDRDGRIVSFTWDMGDGTVLRASAIRHRYRTPGIYTVSLTVIDDDGMTGTSTMLVDIRPRGSASLQVQAADTTGNETRATAEDRILSGAAPVAVVAGPALGRINDWLNYTGRSSYDTDGRIASFTWDMGDGTTLRASAIRHRYRTPGIYTVTLTVTDDDGMTGTMTQTVDVRPRR